MGPSGLLGPRAIPRPSARVGEGAPEGERQRREGVTVGRYRRGGRGKGDGRPRFVAFGPSPGFTQQRARSSVIFGVRGNWTVSERSSG